MRAGGKAGGFPNFRNNWPGPHGKGSGGKRFQYGMGDLTCHACGGIGHERDRCPMLAARACSWCGAKGHFVKDCPKKAAWIASKPPKGKGKQ